MYPDQQGDPAADGIPRHGQASSVRSITPVSLVEVSELFASQNAKGGGDQRDFLVEVLGAIASL
jgi:hypothetical protein